MKIFEAIGLGLTLIIVKILMPEVFNALANTILMFFKFLQFVLSFAGKPAVMTSVLLPQ